MDRSTFDLILSKRFKVKWAGTHYKDVLCEVKGERIYVSFPYDAKLIAEVKRSFDGRKWCPDTKRWHFPISQRNIFQLEALQGKYGPDPTAHWKKPLAYEAKIREWADRRGIKLLVHQIAILNHILTKKHFLAAAEMGLGKTLCAIAAAEILEKEFGEGYFLWIGPKGPLAAVRNEFIKWKTKVYPEFMTYQGLVGALRSWTRDTPRYFVIDEISMCKTGTTQRSKACQYVADNMRDEFGYDSLILGLTGSPAPKSPCDWHSPMEIVCPGWITEANVRELRQRLGVLKEESDGVTSYKKLETWKDDVDKCDTCGHTKEQHTIAPWDYNHTWQPSKNEIKLFGARLKGPSEVWLKKDCLDLPDKRYETVQFEPTQEILALAKIIVGQTTRAVDALIKLRTLSDGFLYEDSETGDLKECDGCNGTGVVNITDVDSGPCCFCGGIGRVAVVERITRNFECPKVDYFKQLLSEHLEVGRFVTYAGFQGSIDRLQIEALKEGWSVLKADGRGWTFTHATNGLMQLETSEMLRLFQDSPDDEIVFIGQPGAAGMGLTLTRSPSIFFYSNDFNPQSRIQAEDRIHRVGMDLNRGCRIIDCIHLPSDMKVITSLMTSVNLQSLTMEELRNFYK